MLVELIEGLAGIHTGGRVPDRPQEVTWELHDSI